MNIRQMAGVVAGCLFSSASFALELGVHSGYNDNPFKQETQAGGSSYTALNLSHKGRTAGRSHLQYSFDIYGENHQASDADRLDANASVRWVAAGRLFDRSASLLFTADARSKRGTFVDQLTGDVARTSRDQAIGDRFSYNAVKLGVEGIYRFSRYKSMALYVYTGERNYVDDYASIGLEALDFSETGIQPSVRFKSTEGHYVKLMAYQKYRSYQGLLDDDLRGMNVSGSTVDYTLSGLGLLALRQLSESSTLRVYLQGYQARDDFVGARDMDFWKADITFEHQFQHQGVLVSRTSTFDRSYRNDVISRLDSEVRVPGKKQSGRTFSLMYKQPIQYFSENLTWFCKIESSKVNNSDSQRSYTTNTFQVGINYRW